MEIRRKIRPKIILPKNSATVNHTIGKIPLQEFLGKKYLGEIYDGPPYHANITLCILVYTWSNALTNSVIHGPESTREAR
jgi:hypothetical protein